MEPWRAVPPLPCEHPLARVRPRLLLQSQPRESAQAYEPVEVAGQTEACHE